MLSIIIPHLKGKQNLNECIQSINTKINHELIVIDNNSTDGSIHYIKEQYPDVKVIHSKINLGYAGGCNLGAQHAIGDYLFFLNDDTVLENQSIEILLNTIQKNKYILNIHNRIII